MTVNLNHLGTGGVAPYTTNNWIQFTWHGVSGGAIQGTANSVDHTSPYGNQFAYIVPGYNHNGPQTLIGNAQFASGGHDFGEFMEAGNLAEWDDRVWTEGSPWRIGIPEGMLVWVIEGKFYKNNTDGVGTPMVITNRSAIVGNSGPTLKNNNDNRKGEILSFIGQLPVIIRGSAKTGDLIVPVEGENFCQCISKDNIDFKTYMMAIGTCWESCDEYRIISELDPIKPNESTNMHYILCAIGIK